MTEIELDGYKSDLKANGIDYVTYKLVDLEGDVDTDSKDFLVGMLVGYMLLPEREIAIFDHTILVVDMKAPKEETVLAMQDMHRCSLDKLDEDGNVVWPTFRPLWEDELWRKE